ncbi:MAG: T9SS type A sorting domain-containing protein [candidate division WOR-3 bacterium]|nr:T9SS type A sorting domain-containing protein [candidate division WOR-3 bacterium]
MNKQKAYIVLLMLAAIMIAGGDEYVITSSINYGNSAGFREIGPHIFDCDNDSNYEFTCHHQFNNGSYTERHIFIFEHAMPGDSFIMRRDYKDVGFPAGFGDFDSDGLGELLVIKRDSTDTIYVSTMEQADSFLYPDSITWICDSVYDGIKTPNVSTMMKGDSIDRIYGSGIPWLSSNTTNRGWYYYSPVGDNDYRINNTFLEDSFTSRMTAGDFDSDNYCDIIIAVHGSTYWLESVDSMQDSFTVVNKESYTTNLPDNYIILPDIDRDGKNEILTNKAKAWPTTYTFRIIEYDSVSYWDTIWTQTFEVPTDNDYVFGSDMSWGDTDGDGEYEMVISAGIDLYVFDILSDNTFEQKFYYRHDNFGMIQSHVRCHDFNGNGYDEIVFSGNGDDIGDDQTLIFEDSSVVLYIDSVVAYEGDSILEAGIDNDDYAVLYFSNRSNVPLINSTNIDSIFTLSSGHTWKDMTGSIKNCSWSADSTQCTVELSDSSGIPTIAVGDTIVPSREHIKIYTEDTPVKGRAVLRGSFSPSGITCNNKDTETDIYYDMSSGDISFSLKTPSQINLTLFDITGRQVKQVYSGYAQKGIYTEKLPDNLNSGVYYLNFKSALYNNILKILYIR